jgi:hypothetical protein
MILCNIRWDHLQNYQRATALQSKKKKWATAPLLIYNNPTGGAHMLIPLFFLLYTFSHSLA